MVIVHFEAINAQLEKRVANGPWNRRACAPSHQVELCTIWTVLIAADKLWMGLQLFSLSAPMFVWLYLPNGCMQWRRENEDGPSTRSTAMRWARGLDFSYKKISTGGEACPSGFGFIWRESMESLDLYLPPSQLFGSRKLQAFGRLRKKHTWEVKRTKWGKCGAVEDWEKKPMKGRRCGWEEEEEIFLHTWMVRPWEQILQVRGVEIESGATHVWKIQINKNERPPQLWDTY